ncbi:MAG: hypothetical protein V3T78_06230, partial [Dehalococcoidia bacterium]
AEGSPPDIVGISLMVRSRQRDGQAHHERIIFPLSLSLSKAVRTTSGNKAALREILRPDVHRDSV